MNNKKKYHGGLKVLLLPLFIMLLGMCSISYALTPSNQITDYGTQQLIDYFYSIRGNYVQDGWNKMDNFNSFYSNLQVSSVTATLNNTFTTWQSTFPYLEQISFSFAVSDSTYRLIAIQNNNTIGNTLPFIKLNGKVYSSSSNYSPNFIDDIGNNSSGTTLLFTFNTNGTLTYNGYQNTIPSLSYKLSPLFNKIDNTDTANIWNFISFGNSTFYLKSDNIDTLSWVWNTNKIYNEDSQPEAPSGDIPSNSGLGNITNSSGDSGGNINLQPIQESLTNIQNQISGDSQKLIENQNQNTQTIVNTISGEVNKINNTLTEYDENEGEDGVNDLINNIQTSLSGDLNNSEIFGALEESEKGFLNLISGQAEDFIISWNDVFYQGVKLIPAGSINFNALCRENQSLSNVKEKLNIILSALCGLALIKYLYNLLLATLGIDNPYLYDKTSDSHINNSSVTVRDTTKVNFDVYDKHGNKTGWGRDER